MTSPGTEAQVHISRWRIHFGFRRSWLAMCCGLMLAATCFAASDSSANTPCRDSVDSYVGYKLTDVRIVTPLAIKTPLSFLFGSQKKFNDEFDALLTQMPLKKGDAFDREAHNANMEVLFNQFDETVVDPGERIRFAFRTFRFDECNDAARTVRLTYLIYSSEFLYHASRIFEKPNNRFTRSAAPGKFNSPGSLANSNGKLLPQPLVGYDRAREVFAGGKADFQTENGIIDQMSLNGTASANSADADFNLAGSREFRRSFLSHVDWRMGYNYFNLPSDPNTVKAGTGLAQVFGASKPLGRNGLTFRFGASVEGGNRQSDLPVSILDPNLVQQLGYGALKAYLGATANRGRRSWTASYGVQLSSDGEDPNLSYTKHLFDAGYRLRYLWREHSPFRMEAQFSAGIIQARGTNPVPVAERFFGGNKIRPFIDGDDWIINSAPFIRSFPQTSLNLVGVNAPFGGEHFFSANLTLSQPFWNIPAVPRAISQEQFVRDAIGGALRTARTATVKSYLDENPEYLGIRKVFLGDEAVAAPANNQLSGNLIELAQAVDDVDAQLTTLNDQHGTPAEVLTAIERIGDEPVTGSDLLQESKDAIEGARTNPGSFKAGVRGLFVGFTRRKALIPRLATGLDQVVEALRRAQMAAAADTLSKTVITLRNLNESLKPQAEKLIEISEIKMERFRPVMSVVKNKESADDVDEVVKKIGSIVGGMKTRANTMSGVGRASLLRPVDIKLPKKLAVKLRDQKDSVSKFLNAQFSAETRELLKAYKETAEPSDQLVSALISELNRLLSGPNLFTDDRFEDVELSEETEELAGANLDGAALLALNRSLLAESFPGEISRSDVDELLDPLDGLLKDANLALTDLEDFESSSGDVVHGAVHQLAVGFTDLSLPVTTLIDNQINKLQPPLAAAGLATEANALVAEGAKLNALGKQAQQLFNKIQFPEIEQQADRDIAFAARSLDVVFRELNLIEIAPVVTFDAARIGPATSPGFGKTHYGLGAGVRFSLVTLDFTAGYSFNLNRQPTEPRGAVLLSMTISDLFR